MYDSINNKSITKWLLILCGRARKSGKTNLVYTCCILAQICSVFRVHFWILVFAVAFYLFISPPTFFHYSSVISELVWSPYTVQAFLERNYSQRNVSVAVHATFLKLIACDNHHYFSETLSMFYPWTMRSPCSPLYAPPLLLRFPSFWKRISCSQNDGR